MALQNAIVLLGYFSEESLKVQGCCSAFQILEKNFEDPQTGLLMAGKGPKHGAGGLIVPLSKDVLFLFNRRNLSAILSESV